MSLAVYLPLVPVAALVALVVIAPRYRPIDRTLGRVSFLVFGRRGIPVDEHRRRLLRSAHVGTPYRLYVTKTYLYMSIGALSGAVIGGYVGGVLVELLRLTPATDSGLVPIATLFGVLLAVNLGFGVLGASTAYGIRWQVPALRADARRRQIDAAMPRILAFIYALARGGMSVPDVMRTLSRNREVYGEGAREIAVGVRDIDLFGRDVVTAVRAVSQRSPSDAFQTFAENLTSVLQSGQNLTAFLDDEYERYREEAEDQQAEVLEVLATTAEIYVTLVVAGVLFLVTILLIIGITGGSDTLPVVRLIAYVVLPALNVLFIAYLSEVTKPLGGTRGEPTGDAATTGPAADDVGGEVHEATAVDDAPSVVADGGYASASARANRGRVRAYRRLVSIRRTLGSPLAALRHDPTLVLYLTVPIAVGIFASHLPAIVADGQLHLRVLDDALVLSTMFLTGTFALVYEYHRRHLQRLETAVPDLLERLASINEAGVSIVGSFDRVRRSDMGTLDEEIDRVWRDIQWGSSVERALGRLERRIRTPSVTRVVSLLTNAMRASNEIGPVLRIAADQARADLRLKRRRRQEMLTYLIVIYIAFFVFLVVIGVINFVLVPSLPETGTGGATLNDAPAATTGLGGVDTAAYQLVFFHTGLVQALFSGLVGGQMGDGSVEDGMKHATIMLAATFVLFTVVSI